MGDGVAAANPADAPSRRVGDMSDTVVISLTDLVYGATYEVHLRHGDVFRGELDGSIGFSGDVRRGWFVVEGERHEVRANDFVSATPVS